MNVILKLSIIAALAIIPLSINIKPAQASFFDAVFAKEEKTIPANLDLEARKKMLDNIAESTQLEISGLKNKLEDLDLTEDWNEIRDKFIEDLSDFETYNQTFNDKIGNSKISLEEIKELAKELKDWREENYTPKLKEITNMTFIFDEENLLKITRERLDKISSDIKKLDKQNIIRMIELKNLFSKAEKTLKEADNSKNEAKKLFFKTISTSINASSTVNILQESATSTETDGNLKSEKRKEPEEKISQTSEEIQTSIRNSLMDSLKQIKATYEIFFQMNNKIKKYL